MMIQKLFIVRWNVNHCLGCPMTHFIRWTSRLESQRAGGAQAIELFGGISSTTTWVCFHRVDSQNIVDHTCCSTYIACPCVIFQVRFRHVDFQKNQFRFFAGGQGAPTEQTCHVLCGALRWYQSIFMDSNELPKLGLQCHMLQADSLSRDDER